MRRLVLCCALVAGCGGDEVDSARLPSIAGWETWPRKEVRGFVPGHGDTYRIIYVNPKAQEYPHGGPYAVGTILVKAMHEDDGGRPGKLQHLNIMRKLGDLADPPATLDRGWLFTDLRDGKEKQKDSCFDSCHRQGPFDYAWLDYGL